MLQAITCTKCGESYLVGINNLDVRKTKGSSGHLEGVPYVAFGHDETKDCPTIKEGDVISCPKCDGDCTVHDMQPVKGD